LAAFTVATPGETGTLLDWNPGANDRVSTLAAHDNVLYAGGSFIQAGGQPRARLAAFTVATLGEPRTLLHCTRGAHDSLTTLAGHAIVLCACGSVIGPGGQPCRPLAAFTVATPGETGTLLDWNPGANDSVNTLAVHDNVLYAGGYFTQAGGQTRGHLAAFTVANGAAPGNTAVLPDRNPGASGLGLSPAVHSNVLYAGGWFSRARGQTRNYLAAFTVANGATPGNSATLLDWNPGSRTTVRSLIVDNEQILG